MTAAAQNILVRMRLPGSAMHLGVVRIVIVAHVVSVLTTPAFNLIFFIPAHVMQWTETILPLWLEEWIAEHLRTLVSVGLAAAGFSFIGLFTRPALVVLTVVFFLTQNFWFRMSLFHDDWLYFNVFLCILASSRCGDALSVDALIRKRRGKPAPKNDPCYRWPIELMIAWFAGIYIAAGLAKIFPLVKVPGWFSGRRPQAFAQQFFINSPIYWVLERPLFDYGAVRFPFAMAAIFTLIAELGPVVLFFTLRPRWLVVGAILSLHFGILLVGIPGFLQAALACAPLFISPERFPDWSARGSPGQSGSPRISSPLRGLHRASS